MLAKPKFDGPPSKAFSASTKPIDAVPSAATAAMMLPRFCTSASATAESAIVPPRDDRCPRVNLP
jgi:hypothetical protein